MYYSKADLLPTNKIIKAISKSQGKFKLFLSGQKFGQIGIAFALISMRLDKGSVEPFKKFLSGQKFGQTLF